jgi:hypothetical protein
MARRLFHLSLSLLCLVAAYQLGAERARAEWNGTASGSVIGGFSNGSTAFWYTGSGEAWSLNAGVGWERVAEWDLPVPFSEVKFMDEHAIITTADEGWLLVSNTWQSFGQFPGGPVPLQKEPWGKIKGRYHD